MFARKISELGYRLNNNQTREFDHPPLAYWRSRSLVGLISLLSDAGSFWLETVFAGTAPYPVSSRNLKSDCRFVANKRSLIFIQPNDEPE